MELHRFLMVVDYRSWMVTMQKAYHFCLQVLWRGLGLVLHQDCCLTEVDSTGLTEPHRFLTVVDYRSWMVTLPKACYFFLQVP